MYYIQSVSLLFFGILFCVILPIIIVYIIQRRKTKEIEKRSEFILAVLEKRPEINVERLVRHFNAPKNSFKEKLINKLTIGLVFMFVGLGILVSDAIIAYLGGWNPDAIFWLAFTGAVPFTIGLAFLLSFFIANRMLAEEIEAEKDFMTK